MNDDVNEVDGDVDWEEGDDVYNDIDGEDGNDSDDEDDDDDGVNLAESFG